MRVYEIARELDVESKVVLQALNELGVAVKSHANSVSEEEAARVRQALAGESGQGPEPLVAGPEAEIEIEPEAEAEPEVGPEPEPEVEPEPEPEGELEAEAEPEPGAAADAEPEPEPEQEVEPEPAAAAAPARAVAVEEGATVGQLAEAMGISPAEIIRELMGRGAMANVNQALDADVAVEIAAEHGVALQLLGRDEVLLGEIETGSSDDLEPRAPVVTIMGHVDHGKTHLLDSIRQTNVVAREAGGITQHIGASEVEWNGNRIVFIDTPGHEAFTRMRARGAQVTDLVVLVLAADDGVMPQTVEAIDHARAANVPIIVAVNKIDRPEANVDRAKQQLVDRDLTPEDWGGDTVCVAVSAKTKENLDGLLEMIILSSELLELRANPKIAAHGVVLEAELDRRRGPVATVLVQAGTLAVADSLVAGAESAKVRAMFDSYGNPVKEAGPATAVEVLGFSGVPGAGDSFQVVEQASLARKVAELRRDKQRRESLAGGTRLTLADLHARIEAGGRVKLSVVLRADTQGSTETLRDALGKLSGDKVEVQIIRAAVGGVSEHDVLLASASEAIIVGFNVRPERGVADIAASAGVDLRLYTVIYQLIDDVKQAMVGKLDPTFEDEELGQAEVRETFRIPRIGSIAGCYVTGGKVTRAAKVRLVRDSRIVYEGQVRSLRRFKDDVAEVGQGYECGIALENFNDVKVGDMIEFFVVKEIRPSL